MDMYIKQRFKTNVSIFKYISVLESPNCNHFKLNLFNLVLNFYFTSISIDKSIKEQ